RSRAAVVRSNQYCQSWLASALRSVMRPPRSRPGAELVFPRLLPETVAVDLRRDAVEVRPAPPVFGKGVLKLPQYVRLARQPIGGAHQCGQVAAVDGEGQNGLLARVFRRNVIKRQPRPAVLLRGVDHAVEPPRLRGESQARITLLINCLPQVGKAVIRPEKRVE